MTRKFLDKLLVIGGKYTALKGETYFMQTDFAIVITLYTIKCDNSLYEPQSISIFQ